MKKTIIENRNKLRLPLVVRVALGAIGLLLLAIGLMGLLFPIPCPIIGCPSPTSPTYATNWDEIQAGYAMVVLGMIVLGIGLTFGSMMVKVGSNEKHSTAASGI